MVETVVIVDTNHPNGEYVINAADFDPAKHTKKGEEVKPPSKKAKNEEG